MKFRNVVVILLLFVSLPIYGETKIGLGTTLNTVLVVTDSSTSWSTGFIYLPIKINSKIVVEPYLIYRDFESRDYDNDGDTSYTYDTYSRGLGVGVFYMSNLHDAINGYFGGRLSWQEAESTYYGNGNSSKSEREYVTIAPIVGLEYQAHELVYLAIEAGVGYSEVEAKSESGLFASDNEDGDGFDTFSNIMLRIMF